ncbi:MAG TPA: ABC transporter permease [Bryobacteraceae bacterium]|nr:ABC transporter permease [Bryobacteraceae bacterium]
MNQRRRDRELLEEMQTHLEERAADLMREGLSEDEARARARREFGNMTSLRQQSHDVWIWPSVDELWRALVHAARALRRGGAYTVVSIATLALGIGVNASMFSIIDAVLLRPLPYANPDRLVRAGATQQGHDEATALTPEFLSWRKENHSFIDLATWNWYQCTLNGAGEPEVVAVVLASGNLLALLGVQPVLGRDFSKDDDRPGAPRVALISNDLWWRHWHGDPSVVGRTMILNTSANFTAGVVRIAGVLPEWFRFPDDTQPAILLPAQLGEKANWSAGTVGYGPMIGRLRAHVSLQSAAADLARVTRAHQSDEPPWMAWSLKDAPFSVLPLQQSLVSGVRPALLTLLGAVGFVLLIACVNVANLQLSRFHGRMREIGVRAALGASKFQLLRLVLAECLLLSAVGTVLGLAGAWLLIRLAKYESAMLHLSDPRTLSLNGTVAAFSFALALACALICAIGPALLVTRADAQKSLRRDDVHAAPGLRNIFRSAMMAGEVALAVVLLLAAGLLLRSFARLIAIQPGFEARGVLTASLRLSGSRYGGTAKKSEFVRALMRRIETAPGLIAAGAASSPPFVKYNLGARIYFEGQTDPPYTQFAPLIAVTPDYFRSLKIPVIAGRNFSSADSAGRPGVAIINVAFAQTYFSREDPIGKHMTWNERKDWATIVGVVANAQHEDLATPPSPEIFTSFDQYPQPLITLTLRTSVPPETLVKFVRAQVAAIDPEEPLYDISSMENRIDKTLRDRRVETFLLGAFAALALLLAAAGVYGVMSYSVAQSRREIGVRLALGATPGAVTREILKRALALTAGGVAAGLAASFYATRFLAAFLYGVGAKDPLTFFGAAAFLIVVSLLASFLPARRAARVDPVQALRSE